jgi:MSHA biogenesis protein MshK
MRAPHATLAAATFVALGLAWCASAAAQAAGLADPMRPPTAAAPAVLAARAGTAPRPAASPASAASAAAPPPAPQLQSVQLGAVATALVDGRLVRIGDRVGGAQVIAIDMQGLQLQGPHGTERLRLLSAVIQHTPLPNRPAPPHVAVAGEP